MRLPKDKELRDLAKLIALIILFVFAYTTHVYAEEKIASFDFDNMTLNEVVQGSLRNYLKKDYIADNDFLTDDRKITIFLKDYPLSRFQDLLFSTIRSYDYQLKQDGDLIKIWRSDQNVSSQNYSQTTNQYQADNVLPSNDLHSTDVYRNRRGVGITFDDPLHDANDTRLFQSDDTYTMSGGIPEQQLYTHELHHRKPSEIQSLLGNLFEESQISFSKNDLLNDRFVFKGTEEQNLKIIDLLSSLDQSSDQVQVKAFLYELQKSSNKQNGISAFLNLINDTVKVSVSNAQRLSNYIQLKNENFNVVLSALNNSANFKLLSNPTIFVKNRKTGLINVGEEVPTLGQIVTNANGQQSQSINYVKTGLTLKVIPTIFKQDIELKIRHSISNALPNDTGINNTPKLVNRTFETTIDTHDNDILLIGGLNETKLSNTNSGLSFIPFINSKTRQHNDNELMLMLHVKRI